MSKPRKPGDPDRWPEPCGRCGQHHQIAATWPDARVCGYCYQAAKRTAGTCACGHQGILPGRVAGRPACRRCSGVRLNLDCASCGAEAELHSGGRCWSCVLGATVDQLLTSPRTGAIDAALQPVAAALKSMTSANSGLIWISQCHVKAFLAELAARPAITHDILDALPAHPTREHVRGLLVEHGALPRRDERRVRYQAWSEQALQRLPDQDRRDVVRRFIRWHLLRRMNAMATVSEGTFLRSKRYGPGKRRARIPARPSAPRPTMTARQPRTVQLPGTATPENWLRLTTRLNLTCRVASCWARPGPGTMATQ